MASLSPKPNHWECSDPRDSSCLTRWSQKGCDGHLPLTPLQIVKIMNKTYVLPYFSSSFSLFHNPTSFLWHIRVKLAEGFTAKLANIKNIQTLGASCYLYQLSNFSFVQRWELIAILVSWHVHCCLKIRQINMAGDKDSIWQILPRGEIKWCSAKWLSERS